MLIGFVIAWAVNAVALAITAELLPDVEIDDTATLIVSALVVGFLNALIKPIVQLLALPITLMTFGLFALAINAFFVMLAAWVVPGFEIDGFVTAFVAAIVLAVVSTVVGFAVGLFVKR
jgi:putative membrane protein